MHLIGKLYDVVIKAMPHVITQMRTTSMSTILNIRAAEFVRIKFFDFFLLMFPDAKGELESFIMTHH